jgi:HEXXH motif-containing protein
LAESPRKLAKTVMGRLAESFAYIATQAGSEDLRQKLLLVAERLGGLRAVPPQLGCLYLQIVEAVEGGDETTCERLSAELLDLLSRPWKLEVARYGRDELGRFFQAFNDVLFDESYGPQPMAEPPESEWRQAKANFERGLQLVRGAAPKIHAEIEAFWSRIYLGVSNPDSDRAKFGGVTSLVLWGGTFANAAHYDSEIKAAEFLVHEVTHALLFAAACDEPLVLNPPDQFFSSPLRRDGRPMDGIFHATLVCARVAEFYSALRGSDAVPQVDDETLVRFRQANAERFQRGCATIEEFGQISPLGRDLFEQAKARIQVLQNEG